MNENIIENSIKITEPAIFKIYELIQEENNNNLKLRIFVQGGGCSGFQYGFTFDEVENSDDLIIHNTIHNFDVQLLVDSMSLMYLQGSQVDYVEDLQGAQFVIKNPNATTTCGCGSSFSV